MTNKIIGKYGEDLAKNFLINKGYEILEMNYRYSKIAEIDIIAKKNNIIHFVEVKTRTTEFFGSPIEAITKTKLNSIYKCGMYYLSHSNVKYKKMQIDAIGIVINKDRTYTINLLEDINL